MTVTEDDLALVALATGSNPLTEGKIRSLLNETESASDACHVVFRDVYDQEIQNADRRVQMWLETGIRTLTVASVEYPAQLLDAYDHPPVIYVRGVLPTAREKCVAIVGSRQTSDDVLHFANDVALAFSKSGYVIVSGLALGVDAIAHRAALHQGTRTVAVVGTGLNMVYPPQNEELAEKIIASHGLVVSQFAPGTRTQVFHFPMRNKLMSAYAQATIVIHADEKSGTRHQAFAAIKQGRPLVLSEQVVKETSWGRKLVSVHEDNVSVMHTPEEAPTLVETALNPPMPEPVAAMFDLNFAMV